MRGFVTERPGSVQWRAGLEAPRGGVTISFEAGLADSLTLRAIRGEPVPRGLDRQGLSGRSCSWRAPEFRVARSGHLGRVELKRDLPRGLHHQRHELALDLIERPTGDRSTDTDDRDRNFCRV